MIHEAIAIATCIKTSGALPKAYVPKSTAIKAGWRGGTVENVLPGKMIGGDKYYNRSGALPNGNYKECDIGTLGKSSRGENRLVYSLAEDRFFYTSDHYQSFKELSL